MHFSSAPQACPMHARLAGRTLRSSLSLTGGQSMRQSLLAAVVAATFLAGCGGGGGAAPPIAGGGSSGTGTQSSLSSTDVAQTSTDAAFEPMDTGEADAAVGNGALGTASNGRSPQSLGHACKNRTTRTVTVNPDGSIKVETIHYFDNACTQVERDAVAILTSSGRIANVAKPSINASYGRQSTANAAVATDASGDTTFTGTRNGIAFKAALNGLTLSSVPPFIVSGGTSLGTTSLTGSITFDSDGNLTAVALNGTLLNGNTLVVTSSTDAGGAVTVSGTITSPAGAVVATFSTDADGDGILTLANGTQVPIVDWHVVW